MHTLNGKNAASPALNLPTTNVPWPVHWPLPAKTRDADDQTLITLIRDGSDADSERALETLFIRHHKDVWRFVRSRVSSASDADEIAAAVWVVVLEKIYDFVWTGTPIKAWLLSIANLKLKEFFNNPQAVSLEMLNENREDALQYVASQLQLIDNAGSPVSPQVRKEADEILHRLIKRLSKVERQIITLIYFEELETATDVAERLGMNKNTIRVYHKRARDKLRAAPELHSLFEGTD